MNKTNRLSEQFFNKILWAIAIVFAFSLIGFGSKVVVFLPKLSAYATTENFVDKVALATIKDKIEKVEITQRELSNSLQRVRLDKQKTDTAYLASKDTYENWLQSRTATQRSEQNPEVLLRVKTLDALKKEQIENDQKVQELDKKILSVQQEKDTDSRELTALLNSVSNQVTSANKTTTNIIFLYRLLFTLPLLALAGWLLHAKRKTKYWPFVYGFAGATAFEFFFELVPYMPDYGGFVKYTVGIIATIIGGRYAIIALQKYQEKQAFIEKLPEQARRTELNYDTALARIYKKVCPGCERSIDFTNNALDFCNHCGIAVHINCSNCKHRNSAFSKYCEKCGECLKKEPQSEPTQRELFL